MLTEIIAKYLQVTPAQAQAIIDSYGLENLWAQKHTWSYKTNEGTMQIAVSLDQIQTQADLITFLQAAGQAELFGGHDRAQFAKNESHCNDSKSLDDYYHAFAAAGLCAARNRLAKTEHLQYAIVLGSSETKVKQSIASLLNDLEQGLIPEKNIIGLGTTDRPLDKNVPTSETASKEKLIAMGQDANEMNMVDLLIKESLACYPQQLANYVSINTSTGISRSQAGCATTIATASNLKDYIVSQANFSDLTKPILITIYSAQPFIERQTRDIQNKLGPDYKVIGIGKGLSYDEFSQVPNSISICLGEIARLININFNVTQLQHFNVLLTPAEKKELISLSQSFKKASSPLQMHSAFSQSHTKEQLETKLIDSPRPRS